MNIFLIGYRGTGKSTIAPLLARRLPAAWHAVDLDPLIEARAGAPIAAIFARGGEPAFRDLEEAVLRDVARHDGQVIATGGGAVLRASNQGILRRGWVVWLTARPETIERRLRADATTVARRPNLTALGGMEEIRAVLADREPLYRQLAQVVLPTDDDSVDQLVEAIVDAGSADGRVAALLQAPRPASTPAL